ncbi:Heavy metal-associated isoprenylated plant protein 20 [Linum perenne]
MGFLDSISDYLSDLFTDAKPRRKRRAMQTVEIKVKMDCEGCERRVRNSVSHMRGAKSVVLRKVRSTGKNAELWPYVEYNLVAYPYAAGAYDKKAPSGYVRNVPQALPTHNDETYTTIFSDDNPNAYSLM